MDANTATASPNQPPQEQIKALQAALDQAHLQLEVKSRALQPWNEWAHVIAIQPDGFIMAFEEDCYFVDDQWIPIDDFDGLRLEVIERTLTDFPLDVAKKLYFRLPSPPAEPEPKTETPARPLSALPLAGPYILTPKP